MHESVFYKSKVFLKLLFDSRTFRGRTEFSYRIKRGCEGRYRIGVDAKDSSFHSTVLLRHSTSDLSTFEQVFVDNAYNLRRLKRWDEIVELYRSIEQQGTPLIIDAGANIGLASLYFTKNWPEAHIIAIEPEERNYNLMCENFIGIENALPLHAAVASEDGFVRIMDPEAEAWAIRTEPSRDDSDHAIKSLSVQSIIQMAPDGSIPFIAKIDIEGFENDLFSKNTSWVELFPIIIIETHDWMLPREGNARNFLRAVSQHDRDFILFGENVVSIANSSSFSS